MKKIKLFLIACLSGVLLSFAWPEKGFAPLLLIAFLPLLWVEDQIANDTKKRFSPFAGLFYSYIPFLIWNLLTTYWVFYSTPVAILAFTVNSLLMSVAFQLFHYTKRRLYNGKGAYFALVIYWLAFEYFHMNWDLSWPWLTLGNAFASIPSIVQWYEFTGALGGSCWVLGSNILIYCLLKSILKHQSAKQQRIWLALTVTILIIPISLSLILLKTFKEPANAEDCDVVVVQPNLDPWGEQYELSPMEITHRMINMAKPLVDSNTQFVVTPESTVQERIFEDDIQYSHTLDTFKAFIQPYPKLTFIVGMATRNILPKGKKTYAMRELRDVPGTFYERYNTALMVDNTYPYQLLHKSKLTPGVEIMPYINSLPFLKNVAIDLGGTVGSLGVSDKRIVFTSSKTGTRVATVICYESIYGDYVSKYARQGVDLIFIITNDGWWNNSPGHRQHMLYSRLRAIEFRKWIARSANTGISAFVSPTGEIAQKTKYWEQDVIKMTLKKNNIITFYARYGDYLGRIALVAAGFLFLITFVRRRLMKKSVNKTK